MKLLDVEVILGCGPDIQQREVMKELYDEGLHYAILSHRWGKEEVGYEEMIGLMGMEAAERENVWRHERYQKIIKSCNQAKQDGYRCLWIDTCCIDKRSSAELSEAINSMYQWYQNAQVCYAYLNDVQELDFPFEQDEEKFRTSNSWPEWFMRGWTLQELIAPREVEFFNKDWVFIGNKRSRADVLEKITRIPREVLTDGLDAKPLCVAQIMSWAAHRKTTRVEDRAYSLMGLFGVNMPMVYGEGKKAFRRLQLEIIRESSDHSIFSWCGWTQTSSVLAEDPSDFQECGEIKEVEADEFVDRLIEEYIENTGLGGASDDIDNQTHHRQKLAALRDVKYSQQFRTFTVSNTGIQVFLPVVPHPKCPSHFAAILACSGPRGNLVTIDLVSSGSSFDRTSVGGLLPASYPEFKILHLTHHQDTNKKRRDFTLDDKHTLHYGFTRCGTYPRKFTGNTITLLSATDDLIVIVYANEGAKSRFAVGLGYYLGQGWVHVVYNDRPATREETWTPWLDFASSAWDRMWNAREEHYQRSPGKPRDKEPRNVHFVKHAHLPRSTLAARVVWGRWEMNNLRIMVDVMQCPGCCDGPYAWTATFNDFGGLGTPGLMNTVCNSYKLKLDGWATQLDDCFGHGIALGDYGDYSDGNFNRTGNIFADMRMPGIDSAYRSVLSHISGFERSLRQPSRDVTFVTASPNTGGTYLTLRQPQGISLPSNEQLVLLLKSPL